MNDQTTTLVSAERALQAVIDDDSVYPVPAVDYRARQDDILHRVCAIVLPDADLGAGVLIGPDLVLTNYHVLRRCFGDKQRQKALRFHFDFVYVDVESRGIGLAEDGLLIGSPHSERDLEGAEQGYSYDNLDFAIARLAEEVGLKPADESGYADADAPLRGWETLKVTPELPSPPGALHIYHHPGQSDIRQSRSTLQPVMQSDGKILKWLDTHHEICGRPPERGGARLAMALMWFNTFPRTPAPVGGVLRENDQDTGKGEGYVFSEDLIAAVEVAMGLGRPLLVTGEPGCGKTEFGYAIARRLGVDQLYYFGVKSTSETRDLLYTYDAVRRFGDAQVAQLAGAAKLPEVGEYIQYQALGRAILDAHPQSKVADLLLDGVHAHPAAPRRSVVVIDEIDKATRDFPNDLLREIEDLTFRVPEQARGCGARAEAPSGSTIEAKLRPIVIITSNEEHQLPDAFLRRCVFFEVQFPDRPILRKIIASALVKSNARRSGSPPLVLDDPDRDKLINLLLDYRATAIEKKPGVSELIDASQLIAQPAGAGPSVLPQRLAATRTALAKLKGDRDIFDDLLASSA